MGVNINCILGHKIKFSDIKSLPARMTEDAPLQLALQRYCNLNTAFPFEWDDEYPIVVNSENYPDDYAALCNEFESDGVYFRLYCDGMGIDLNTKTLSLGDGRRWNNYFNPFDNDTHQQYNEMVKAVCRFFEQDECLVYPDSMYPTSRIDDGFFEDPSDSYETIKRKAIQNFGLPFEENDINEFRSYFIIRENAPQNQFRDEHK